MVQLLKTTRRPRAPAARGLLFATRPRQWAKNLLVLVAPLVSGGLLRDGSVRTAVVAVLAFVGCSSGGYLINDACDVGRDQAHPSKHRRPVAAGVVSVSAARLTGGALMLGSLMSSWALSPGRLTAFVAAYCALSVSYSVGLKAVAYVELLMVAAGFGVRVAAGSVVHDAPTPWWVVGAVSCAALFVVVGKRCSELAGVLDSPAARGGFARRPVLSRYDGTGLRRVAVATAAGGLACHVVGSLHSGAAQPWAALAAVAATLALARYVLLLGRGVGQQPEAALQDVPMLACAASWTVLTILAALP